MNASFGAVIDDVARAMTSGRPADGFAAGVLERVSAEAPQRWHRGVARVGIALAVAAVVVVSLVVGRARFAGREPARAGGPVAQAVPAADGVAQPPSQRAGGRTSILRTGLPQPAPPAPNLLEWHARTIPELAALPAIAIVEIQPNALSIAQLDVMPLGVAPLILPPIGGEGGR